MSAPLMTIETNSDLPTHADCVVVGGGIAGACAAYWLARSGQHVVLLEKGRIGAEQSSRNWGWCRQQNRDVRELPLATKSLTLWEEMAADLNEDLGFQRCGLLYLSNNEAEIEGWAEWGRFARTEGVVSHSLSAKEATERGSATGKSWAGGVWSPTDGIADPSRAAPLIAKGIEKHGGQVIQFCAARGLETTGGSVSAVVTEKGTIKTAQIVVAGGAWASSFVHQSDIYFPQAAVRSSIMSVEPGVEGIPPALHTTDISVTRRGDGGHTLAISGRASVDPTPGSILGAKHFLPMFAKRWRALSPGGLQAWKAEFETRKKWALDGVTPMERTRILDPRPSKSLINETLSNARKLLPSLKNVGVQASWAGYIDSTPDGVPVIDCNLSIPGLTIAAGLSGHGFGIGPGVGHIVADMLNGREPITETGQYKLERFDQSQWGKVAKF